MADERDVVEEHRVVVLLNVKVHDPDAVRAAFLNAATHADGSVGVAEVVIGDELRQVGIRAMQDALAAVPGVSLGAGAATVQEVELREDGTAFVPRFEVGDFEREAGWG